MGKNWFGSLDLAYKYAIVFGSALTITLLAGFIKVMIDKRKLNAFLKEQEDTEKNKQTADQLPIGMREKDEGDLFGVRAIEAGFFGGVAQSAPVSRAGSPTGSRSSSPTRAARPNGYPYSHNPHSSTTLIHQQHNPSLGRVPAEYKAPEYHKGMHDNITISANSSVLSLGSSTRKST